MSLRCHFWALFHHLAYLDDLLWIVGDYFNDILSSKDKLKGLGHYYATILEFQSFHNGCNLLDLCCRVYRFTWSSKQNDGSQIGERLDSFCANNDWLSIFDSWQVDHIFSTGFYHFVLKL